MPATPPCSHLCNWYRWCHLVRNYAIRSQDTPVPYPDHAVVCFVPIETILPLSNETVRELKKQYVARVDLCNSARKWNAIMHIIDRSIKMDFGATNGHQRRVCGFHTVAMWKCLFLQIRRHLSSPPKNTEWAIGGLAGNMWADRAPGEHFPKIGDCFWSFSEESRFPWTIFCSNRKHYQHVVPNYFWKRKILYLVCRARRWSSESKFVNM